MKHLDAVSAFIELARPWQYVKNGFILLPLVFGYKLTDATAVIHSIWGFLSFSLTASAIYALNDILDVDEDRKHPTKKYRPIPDGRIKKTDAIVFLSFLLALSLSISFIALKGAFLVVLIAYIILNVIYSNFAKHIAIIDIVMIGFFFVLRIIAGSIVSGVLISRWIILMTFLLSLFLAFTKRRDDLLIAQEGKQFRKSLDGYSLEFVSAGTIVMAAVVIVSYILYTVSPGVITVHGDKGLFYTCFWVIIGILRYMQTTFVNGKSGSPTKVFLHDFFLQGIVTCWLIHCFIILYVLETGMVVRNSVFN